MSGPYQPHPQQPPPPAANPTGGGGAIAVTTKFLWLAWILFFIKPKIVINGQETAAVWGRNVLPVPAGQHHLHVHVPYFLPQQMGPADLTVPVQAGQTVELEYRAPLWAFSRGAFGPPPQKYPAAGIMIGVLAGVVGLFCFCLCLAVIAS